jgi:L-alanine-DL-glutamate epimerase-like enolase superfamily enzyme
MIVAEIRARRLDVPMREPFTIAGGSHTKARNVLVEVVLEDGTRGWGEGAPMPAFNGETQSRALAAVRASASVLPGLRADRPALWASKLTRSGIRGSSARAAIEIALFDAWSQSAGLPLRSLLGRNRAPVISDVTIPIRPPAEAGRAAARLWKNGVRTLKIKVGPDPDADAERVASVHRAAPRARLIADANAAYDKRGALRFLRLLRERRIRPALFEQPLPAGALRSLRAVQDEGGVPIAADESACRASDVVRLARAGAARVVNLKLMKSGIVESVLMAETAKACGLGLMIGGLVESRLSMTAAAHLASGIGGFSFIDLDTPLFLSKDPMRGGRLRPNGRYELESRVPGVGVAPRTA